MGIGIDWGSVRITRECGPKVNCWRFDFGTVETDEL